MKLWAWAETISESSLPTSQFQVICPLLYNHTAHQPTHHLPITFFGLICSLFIFKLPRLVIERDEKLDSGKVNDFDQIKKDIDFVDKKKGSLSDCGQVGFQSNNANKKHFKFLTPSTTAATKPNVSGKSTETFRQTNQLTIDRYFRDKFKWPICWWITL